MKNLDYNINQESIVKNKYNSFKDFLNKINDNKDNFGKKIDNINNGYENDIKENEKSKNDEIKKIEEFYSCKIKENINKCNLNIEDLDRECKEIISKVEKQKDDFIINKNKAQIILGETIYNNYNTEKGNILYTKNMYNLMYIYYNNNQIFEKIILKTINNWKNEYRQSIIAKKDNKLKNFIENGGIFNKLGQFMKIFY